MFLFSFLDVVVEEWKEELGEKVVIFVFKKEDYVKIFLDNFCDMQVRNEGILIDVNFIFRRKDFEEKFYFVFLVVSSLNVKDFFMVRSVKDFVSVILFDGLIKEIFRCFRKFIYKCEFMIDEDIL